MVAVTVLLFTAGAAPGGVQSATLMVMDAAPTASHPTTEAMNADALRPIFLLTFYYLTTTA